MTILILLVSFVHAIPFQLRALNHTDNVRLDSINAPYTDDTKRAGGFNTTSILSGAKVFNDFAVILKVGGTWNTPPNQAGASACFNPLIAGSYLMPLKHIKMQLFLGLTAPFGSGNTLALTSSNLARSAMDNAMTAVNTYAIMPGVDLVFTTKSWTFQWETTLIQQTRARGIMDPPVSTHTTSGISTGYALNEKFSLQAEILYQHWLTTKTSDNLSFIAGPRAALKIDHIILRPAIGYMQSIITSTGTFKALMIDIPVYF